MDGSVACWGDDEYGEATAPEGEFASVSAGSAHACGVRVDGSVACWGDDEYGEATAPEGEFTSVNAGVGNHTCGVRVDGSVACWGDDAAGGGVRLRQRWLGPRLRCEGGRLRHLLGQ